MAECLTPVSSTDVVVKSLEKLVVDLVVNKNTTTLPLPTCKFVLEDVTCIAILMNNTMPNHALVACGNPGETVEILAERVFKHRTGVAGPFQPNNWVWMQTSIADAKWKLICEELGIDWEKKNGDYIQARLIPLAIHLLTLCQGIVGSTADFGNVYCLFNSSIPNLHKIGFTARNVQERIRELSLDVPEPFKCVHQAYVYQPHTKETIIHNILAEDRHHQRREFFSTKVHRIVRLMNISDISYGFKSPSLTNSDVQIPLPPLSPAPATRKVQCINGRLVAANA